MNTAAHTFLFTDIQGSSGLWERFPDAMPLALEAHNEQLRAAVREHGGHIFKTAGDSVCAVFGDPVDGARAAITAQRSLHFTNWHAFGLGQPLTVRMALQSGMADEQDGDYFGPVLNRTSRLMRAGHGGQVLVCPLVAAAVERHWSSGVRVRDLGERRLRNIPGICHIYQLEIDDLPANFPPLQTLDPIAHNLPAEVNACLDRDTELVSIQHLLLDSPTRLVTLLGPGGIGKTRLALHAAWQLIDAFANGVWFVDLSSIRVAESVPRTIAAAVGARIEPGQDPVAALTAWAGDRQSLLILDNCEQIVDGVATCVATMLPATPGVRLLATSRIPLRIRGEQRIEIGPLPVELDDHAGPAVQLFLERAQQLQPDFELTSSNQTAIVEICHRVDGIPLALELAAARVTSLGTGAVQRRLSSQLALLTSGNRDLPKRHQTLRAAIDWSYALLAAGEQRAFRQLSIFRGGWSLAAAQAVIGLDELETADVLGSLREKSMVRISETAHGELRYSMLETIREFGHEQLLASADYGPTQTAQIAFFVDLASEAAQHIAGSPTQQYWLGIIDQELANFRTAIQHSLDVGDRESAIDLSIDLWFYWSTRGLQEEGQRWLAAALTRDVDQKLRARALRTLGNLCVERGELPAAESFYRISLDVSRSVEHALGIAQSLTFLGMVAGMQGHTDEEYRFQIEALDRCRALGSDRGIATSLVNLAVRDIGQAQYDEALERLDEVRSIFERLQDEISLAFQQIYRAQVLRHLERFDEAAVLLEDAEQVCTRLNAPDGLHFARQHRALVELGRGNLARAALLADDAVEGYRERGDRAMLSEALETAALVSTRLGESARAAELLGAASYLRQSTNAAANPHWSRELEKARIQLDAALGSYQVAVAWERGRQDEMRASWLVVAPPELLESIEMLAVQT